MIAGWPRRDRKVINYLTAYERRYQIPVDRPCGLNLVVPGQEGLTVNHAITAVQRKNRHQRQPAPEPAFYPAHARTGLV